MTSMATITKSWPKMMKIIQFFPPKTSFTLLGSCTDLLIYRMSNILLLNNRLGTSEVSIHNLLDLLGKIDDSNKGMEILSTGLGRIVPNLISRKHTNSATTVLYAFFGLWLLYIAWRSDSKANQKKEMEEVEEKLESGQGKTAYRRFLSRFLTPIFLESSFILTFLAEWGDRSQIATIAWCFEVVSSLRINLIKTKIISVGEVPLLQTWATDFGCGFGSLPTVYLGLPLGANSKSSSSWDHVIDRIDKRLNSWKGKLLSKGGKLTLIKSTLSNLPLYFLSVFLAPALVIKTMERKIRNFLWSKGKQHKKAYHLVNWSQCCQSKTNGGIGIKQLGIMNRALLSKWRWKYGISPASLWQTVINDKFGSTSQRWVPKVSRLSQGTGCWQMILSGTGSFSSNVRFQVRSGKDTRIWLIHWLDGGLLADHYPHLFSISKQKHASISEVINSNGEWAFTFNRELTEDDLIDFAFLIATIGPSVAFLNPLPDQRSWIPDSKGFSVKTCYAALLATHKDAVGVAVGATIGHSICTSIAVVGGSMLVSKISQGTVETVGGLLFLGFSWSSYFYPPL